LLLYPRLIEFILGCGKVPWFGMPSVYHNTRRARTKPIHAAKTSNLWVNPDDMAAVGRACKPLAINKTAAEALSAMPRNARCKTGGFGCLPEVTISSTSEPESEEVIKQMTTSNNPSHLVTKAKGSRSSSE